ncbi:hypothetical protein K469DRAFT_716879 [Zopfia rhizophila CBS 207.26]|uniref:Uncharacterized protein n=1 Tax=Zopfia rhizophila CBS 207.26 TaxID=1314779 RepID=A0A6A6EN13_9PEZI|nr:hypothetical protein K469DRAFT_716879 [Zopfia rhizophila CBS 207.26]
MPPRIPVRFPWASRLSLLPSRTLQSLFRTFTTTTPSLALGPESPNYIDVPKPVQPTFPPKPIVKGVLPIPRNVFKTRSPHPKASSEFITKTTPEPKHERLPGKYATDAELRLYKKRLAEKRRQALREGIQELHERKTTTDRERMARTKRIQLKNRKLALAPPRSVDVLTSTSVSKSIQDYLNNKLSSRSRSNIHPKRREAYHARMAQHAAVRQAHLNDLYTHAREFIVDEEDLDQAIETAFGTEERPVGWDVKGEEQVGIHSSREASPWNGGTPDGVGDMLQRVRKGEGVGLARERVKRVAEELTGGRM